MKPQPTRPFVLAIPTLVSIVNLFSPDQYRNDIEFVTQRIAEECPGTQLLFQDIPLRGASKRTYHPAFVETSWSIPQQNVNKVWVQVDPFNPDRRLTLVEKLGNTVLFEPPQQSAEWVIAQRDKGSQEIVHTKAEFLQKAAGNRLLEISPHCGMTRLEILEHARRGRGFVIDTCHWFEEGPLTFDLSYESLEFLRQLYHLGAIKLIHVQPPREPWEQSQCRQFMETDQLPPFALLVSRMVEYGVDCPLAIEVAWPCILGWPSALLGSSYPYMTVAFMKKAIEVFG